MLEYTWHNMAPVSLSASLFSVTTHNPRPVCSPDSVFSDQVIANWRLAQRSTIQPLLFEVCPFVINALDVYLNLMMNTVSVFLSRDH